MPPERSYRSMALSVSLPSSRVRVRSRRRAPFCETSRIRAPTSVPPPTGSGETKVVDPPVRSYTSVQPFSSGSSGSQSSVSEDTSGSPVSKNTRVPSADAPAKGDPIQDAVAPGRSDRNLRRDAPGMLVEVEERVGVARGEGLLGACEHARPVGGRTDELRRDRSVAAGRSRGDEAERAVTRHGFRSDGAQARGTGKCRREQPPGGASGLHCVNSIGTRIRSRCPVGWHMEYSCRMKNR